jgi:hypothetical protein
VFRLALGPIQPPVKMGSGGSVPRDKAARAWSWPSILYLVPRLSLHGDIMLLKGYQQSSNCLWQSWCFTQWRISPSYFALWTVFWSYSGFFMEIIIYLQSQSHSDRGKWDRKTIWNVAMHLQQSCSPHAEIFQRNNSAMWIILDRMGGSMWTRNTSVKARLCCLLSDVTCHFNWKMLWGLD